VKLVAVPDSPSSPEQFDAAAQRSADVIARTSAPITASMISEALTIAGVSEGSLIMVHSSLSRLGWVAGGAHAVVNTLLRQVGDTGTVVMPSLSSDLSDPAAWVNPPVPADWWQTIRDEIPAYDPNLTPTTSVGAVVECFRHVPGAVRSEHPADSFVAVGPLAERIVHPHALAPAFGEGSPLARLYELDATIVLLGVGHGNNTTLHLAEGRAACARRTMRYGVPMLVDGQRQWVEFVDLDYDSDDFERLGDAFAATGGQRVVPLGVGSVTTCSARDIVDFAVGWMSANRPS
jgi:aminoglycoside 3-N-acetyltransferase